jgi:hypothetical protein
VLGALRGNGRFQIFGEPWLEFTMALSVSDCSIACLFSARYPSCEWTGLDWWFWVLLRV